MLRKHESINEKECAVPIIELTSDNFDKVTSQQGIVMIDCWAAWCEACKSFNPIYERVADKFKNHVFAKINTVSEKQLVDEIGIENIPTLMLFRDGVLLFKQEGYYEEDKLDDIVNQAENVDMDEVRAYIATQENNIKSDNNT